MSVIHNSLLAAGILLPLRSGFPALTPPGDYWRRRVTLVNHILAQQMDTVDSIWRKNGMDMSLVY